MSHRSEPITIIHIADRLGLATCTVSAVLAGKAKSRRIGEKTAHRIRQEAKLLNYVPNDLARSLRRQQTGVVGVVFADFTNDFAERIMSGVSPVFDANGYLSFILAHRWDAQREQKQLQMLLGRRVDAIITVPLPANAMEYRRLISSGTPMVMLGDMLRELPEASYSAWDSGNAVCLTVNHLLNRGRKRVAVLYQHWDSLLNHIRQLSWEQTLSSAGFPLRDEWAISVSCEADVGPALRRVFANPADRPDALYCNNDGLGFLALRALCDLGLRVPEDVAVAGLGDLPRGDEVGAGLTSVREPCEEIGRRAAEAAMALISDPRQGPIQHLLKGEQLLVRRSTAVPEDGHAG